MPATCFRCTQLSLSPVGEPFGACLYCMSFACQTCGVRTAKVSKFYCVTCKSGITLLPSGGLPPTGGGGGQGGGGHGGGGAQGDPAPGGTGAAIAAYASTDEFEILEAALADHTSAEREYYHRDINAFIQVAVDYAFDAVKREDTDRAIGYERYQDRIEQDLRADLLRGAQRLARDVAAANAAGTLRNELLADAFGVAQWAIGVRAGDPVPPERLSMLPDERLRFIVGAAAVAAGPAMTPVFA